VPPAVELGYARGVDVEEECARGIEDYVVSAAFENAVFLEL
jgi:hypothetical protein